MCIKMSSYEQTTLEKLSYHKLRQLAIERGINPNVRREKLIRALGCKYELHQQLGIEGKDGKTFLATAPDGKQVAIKQFASTKKQSSIVREAEFQNRAANAGLSPKVYDVEDGRIVMEKLEKTLYNVFCDQNGQLTIPQQKAIINIFRRLDVIHIFHGDPNPLNFMYKRENDKIKWYIIDFGFARNITDSTRAQMGDTPNLTYMSTALAVKLLKINADANLSYILQFCDRPRLKHVLESERRKQRLKNVKKQ